MKILLLSKRQAGANAKIISYKTTSWQELFYKEQMDQQGMKIALKCIFLLHNILEVTDFNPTLESWTDDYIDAMGSIKEGRYIVT